MAVLKYKNFVVSIVLFSVFVSNIKCYENNNCSIPHVIRGIWFSLENEKNVLTELDATTMTQRGVCVVIKEDFHDNNYTMIFKNDSCYTCVNMIVRNINVLEKIETSCVSLPDGEATLQNVCKVFDSDQPSITLFSENYVPVSCKSSLQGVWTFSYENDFKFGGECRHPDSKIISCPNLDVDVRSFGKRFSIRYKKCEGVIGSFDKMVYYACLGDWYIGKNHYFAVANTNETQGNKRYRCFLKNGNSDIHLGVSVTADCNALKSLEKSPERIHLTAVKLEEKQPRPLCRLPDNFSDEWVNTANIDADVFINDTHIIETWNEEGGKHQIIYICLKNNGTRFMMVRLNSNRCQKDYICFDFTSRWQNLIRYKKGTAMVKEDFNTVCSSSQFENKSKYDLLVKKDPVPVRCPLTGRFNFTQKGDSPFVNRPVEGITLEPRPGLVCKENISYMSVCEADQNTIAVNKNYCILFDRNDKPVYSYDYPDYQLKCIGYWYENFTSYLITFDVFDPLSKYRCWIYQVTITNRILMSQATGSSCDMNQNINSSNYTEGASLAIEMQYLQDDDDQCPLYFDNGDHK